MSDERIVESLRETLNKSSAPFEELFANQQRALTREAEALLIGLRLDGFDVYRISDRFGAACPMCDGLGCHECGGEGVIAAARVPETPKEYRA